MPPSVWQSAERVYELDENDQPVSLKYAVGDPIPLEEAVRQGIVSDIEAKKAGKGKAGTKKLEPSAVENKNGTGADGGEEPEPEPVDAAALEKLGRPELDAKAVEVGVTEPEKLPNKKAVIAAIVAATTPPPAE